MVIFYLTKMPTSLPISIIKFLSNKNVFVFDTETTGLSLQDDIIQIAAAEVVNGVATGKIFEAFVIKGFISKKAKYCLFLLYLNKTGLISSVVVFNKELTPGRLVQASFLERKGNTVIFQKGRYGTF